MSSSSNSSDSEDSEHEEHPSEAERMQVEEKHTESSFQSQNSDSDERGSEKAARSSLSDNVQKSRGSSVEKEVKSSDSDSDGPQVKKGGVGARIQSSSSNNSTPEPQPPNEEGKEEGDGAQLTMADVFGDADDLSSDDDEEERELLEEDIVGPRLHFEEGEEEERAAAPPETLIEVQAPRIAVDLGSQLHFVKFPNFLSVEPRPFEPEFYEDEIDEDEVLDEEGRSRLKLKVENTIRWRHALDEEGTAVKESNAKIVRWSDGTMSLYLGSEIFDVHLQPTVGDHNHLFVRQGAGLQGQDLFRTKLTFRPHSTDTLTHRKMTLSMADRGNKAQKVKVLAAVGKDPESMKQEMVRREEERLRASARRESKQRREREREVRRPLGPGFLEDASDDDDPDAHSLSALKKSFKPGGRAFDRLRSGELSDEDGSAASEDWEAEKSSRLEKAKRVLDSDDDEEAVVASTSETKKKKRVIESDEDDEVGKEDDD